MNYRKVFAAARQNATIVMDETKDNMVALVKFGTIFYVIHEYLCDVTTCIGPSMLPTFNQTGDVVLMERVTTRVLKKFSRGDVVISQSPTNPGQTVCKRIRATAGDVVTLPPSLSHYGRLQGWANRGVGGGGGGVIGGGLSLVVPPGHVWLEGDNALNSTDSRYYGPVPAALVKGVVVVRIWPAMGYVACIPPDLEGTQVGSLKHPSLVTL